jgi:hypothetical protein
MTDGYRPAICGRRERICTIDPREGQPAENLHKPELRNTLEGLEQDQSILHSGCTDELNLSDAESSHVDSQNIHLVAPHSSSWMASPIVSLQAQDSPRVIVAVDEAGVQGLY